MPPTWHRLDEGDIDAARRDSGGGALEPVVHRLGGRTRNRGRRTARPAAHAAVRRHRRGGQSWHRDRRDFGHRAGAAVRRRRLRRGRGGAGAFPEARAQLAQAEQEFQRVSEIFQRKLVAKSSLDAATAARDTTRARVAAARARLAESESQLEKSVVRAPYNGIVTARHIEVGEAAQPGTPLLSGLSLERLRVSVQVPQSVVKSLRESPRAEVRLDGREAWPLADLTLFPLADPATHTVTVRGELPKGRITELFPGMHVKLAVMLGEEPRLVVPEAAVVRRGELTALYVIAVDGRIGLRQVRLGERHDALRSVLAGLSEGEQVAIDPVAAGVALKAQVGR
jgi:RND family efflux transporter MFP subunit